MLLFFVLQWLLLLLLLIPLSLLQIILVILFIATSRQKMLHTLYNRCWCRGDTCWCRQLLLQLRSASFREIPVPVGDACACAGQRRVRIIYVVLQQTGRPRHSDHTPCGLGRLSATATAGIRRDSLFFVICTAFLLTTASGHPA